MNVDRVLLAEPRGFCAGVEMAIKALAWMVRAFDERVYCYHEIVHNKLVVERFEAMGVVFVDDISEVPLGAPVMLSAHGSAPEVVAAAHAAGGYTVDAVCPLVTKVHHEVRTRAAKGYQIVYVGHAGHEEAEGTIAVAPDSVHRVEHPDEVDSLGDLGDNVAILAQTTLSHRDWEGVVDAAAERWPDLWSPGRSWINRAGDLPHDLTGTVGVTAGASAPEEVVEAVVKALSPANGVTVIRHTDEDEYFPPPRNLRDLLSAVRGFAGLGYGAQPPTTHLDDRSIDASAALEALTLRGTAN